MMKQKELPTVTKAGKSTNSPLATQRRLSPHHNAPRNQPITKFTPHHTAGDITLTALMDWLSRSTTRASYNYGISSRGEIGMIVEEQNRSWATSSAWNDHRAITVGVANNSGTPEWTVSDAAWESLVDIGEDVCRRNPGITQQDGSPGLWYDGTQSGSLTTHGMFANTNCPGSYLESRLPELCRRVNQRLSPPETVLPQSFPISPENIQRMVDMGVINSPGFWKGVDCVQWLNELLFNAGQNGRLDRNIDNGISDLETALTVLQNAGVVSTPGYWRSQVQSGNLRFLDQLIINMANRAVLRCAFIMFSAKRDRGSNY